MNSTPKNVKSILKKLKVSESEIADYCINHATEALQENGYKDARLWATNILSNAIGEFSSLSNYDDMEMWMDELEGLEREVVEAILETFEHLYESHPSSDPNDIKDTIVYAISKALDQEDKIKYSRSYA
ncbi:MAG: hypothetical protein ABIG20_00240 [archaeon]